MKTETQSPSLDRLLHPFVTSRNVGFQTAVRVLRINGKQVERTVEEVKYKGENLCVVHNPDWQTHTAWQGCYGVYHSKTGNPLYLYGATPLHALAAFLNWVEKPNIDNWGRLQRDCFVGYALNPDLDSPPPSFTIRWRDVI